MGIMFDTMINYLVDDGWPIKQIEGQPVIHTIYSSDNGTFPCIAFVHEDLGLFSFYVKIPITVPKDKMGSMAMYVAHLNNKAIIGRFLLNFETGEIGFRQTIEADDDELTENMVKNAIMACYSFADGCYGDIEKVIKDS